MEDLSSSSRSFDGLSSFCRSFSRRSRPAVTRSLGPVTAHAAEVSAPGSTLTDATESHRAVAQEQTRAAIEHLLAVMHRWSEVHRRREHYRQAHEGPSPYNRSRIALDEGQAWERWLRVIQRSLENAEEGVVEVVRAWGEAGRSTDEPDRGLRGVIHQGRLYLAVPAQAAQADDSGSRLLVADLRGSLNLDGGLAFVDVVTLPPR